MKKNTNTNAFKKRAQTILASFFDSPENFKEECKHYYKEFGNIAGATMVEHACFAVYHQNVLECLAEMFDTKTDEVAAYYKNNDTKIWEAYKNITNTLVRNVTTGDRCFI